MSSMYLNCKVGNEAGMTGCACIYVNSPLCRGKEWEPLNTFKQDREGLVFVLVFGQSLCPPVSIPTLPLCLLQESVRTSRIAGPSTIHGLQLQHRGCRGLTLQQQSI